MKRTLAILMITVMAGVGAGAQEINYDTASIPAALKKDANVIKRYENIVYEVTDIDRATTSTHQVYTVMNENGRSALFFYVYVSRITQVDDIEIKVYNADGKQAGRYKQKDMNVDASGDGMSLIEDGKYYYIRVPVPSLPATVEYKYVTRDKGTLFSPPYQIIDYDESVQNSTFTARVPKQFDIRFKARNISLKPEEGSDAKYKWYTWKVQNMPTIRHEEGSLNARPYILLAPTRFKLHDYEGDMTSWKSFGQWYSQLYKGRDVLPPQTVNFFKELVKDIPDPKEKARKIYEYLQKNFRYVSIQLGIGGLQPFSAEFTDQKKYGDCKALTNYMRSALSAVGVKSYSAVINAGTNGLPMDPDFPAKFSNHVILCMPLEKDTVWLECTSNTADFGVLGSFTENRNALLITEQGGVLVSTPASWPGENSLAAKTVISLREDGSGNTTTRFCALGEFKEAMKYYLDEKEDDKKRYIVNQMGFKQPDAFAFTRDMNAEKFTTNLQMEIEKVPEFVAGSKMFIAPKLYKLWGRKLPKSDDRKQDYYFEYPFERTDTTIIKLPEGFTVDALPKPRELNCGVATYTTKYWFDEGQKAIYSTTQMILKHQRIPASSFADAKKFFDDILLDDAQRIVIKKS